MPTAATCFARAGSSAAVRVPSSSRTSRCSGSTSVSENGANLLQARGVTKRFGTLAALKDVSFEIREGEILGVIGPNGAGKTALENVMVAALYGLERHPSVRDARARAEEILEQLGLADRGDTPSESLNAPDRKRLEIAKALATEPE